MKTNNTTNISLDMEFIREVRAEIQPRTFAMQKYVLRALRDKDLCHEEDSELCNTFKNEVVEVMVKYQERYYDMPDGVTCFCVDPEYFAIVNCAQEIEHLVEEWYNCGEV